MRQIRCLQLSTYIAPEKIMAFIGPFLILAVISFNDRMVFAQSSVVKEYPKESLKKSKHSQESIKRHDSHSDINLGKIYIKPFNRESFSKNRKDRSARRELDRLYRERLEITKTLERLERRVRQRRSRAKKTYRRSCV